MFLSIPLTGSLVTLLLYGSCRYSRNCSVSLTNNHSMHIDGHSRVHYIGVVVYCSALAVVKVVVKRVAEAYFVGV